MTAPLKLRVTDQHELEILAALLQDALLRPADMTYLADEKRFVAILNRFCWERAKDAKSKAVPKGEDASYSDVDVSAYERSHVAITFDRVVSVKYRNRPDLSSSHDTDRFYSLLTMTHDSAANHSTLHFSDNFAIRIEHKKLSLHAEDLGEAWPTAWRPGHEQSLGHEQNLGHDPDLEDKTNDA